MSVKTLLPHELEPRKLNEMANELARGRSNAVGIVTLDAVLTSTYVEAKNCGLESRPLLTPASAAAAAELAAGTCYISNVGPGFFTITHSAGVADRDFHFATFG